MQDTSTARPPPRGALPLFRILHGRVRRDPAAVEHYRRQASRATFTLPGGSGQWSFGAGVLFFPISYILGDVLTEVYGYARTRGG